MATLTFFNSFFADAMNGEHDLASDVLKIALSNTAPSATDTTLANITQIAAANGYTSGGQALDRRDFYGKRRGNGGFPICRAL
jgi:hypothetical protein